MNEKEREYHRNYYRNRSIEKKKMKVQLQAERRQELRKFIVEYKSKYICICGENHPACLEFHHTDDNKEISIGNASGRGYSLKRLKKEILKCVILCSNCHRKLHYNEKMIAAQILLP